MSNLENKKKILKNLHQNKNCSDEELTVLAEKTKYKTLDVDDLFVDKEEIKMARGLEKKYLEDFNLETISDKELLKSLVYLEVFQYRLQKTANEFKVTNGTIPIQIVDALHRNINQIVLIKDKLGLTKDKKEEIGALKSLELLKKKFKTWREQNQGSRTLVCPHCSKMIMLKIRTEYWEAQKHPFFKDRLLGNEHLIYLYKNNKLTKEDISKILEVSCDYIDWLVEKWKVNTTQVENGVQEKVIVTPLNETDTASNDPEKHTESTLTNSQCNSNTLSDGSSLASLTENFL